MARMEPRMNGHRSAPRRRSAPHTPLLPEPAPLLDAEDEDYGRAWEGGAQETARPFVAEGGFQAPCGEQAAFREQFDEELYNDREDAPAQGNTADVAMGEHRFGSDAEAYTEYAYRRPGEESAVGQARDPADIAEEDERP